MTIGQPGDRKGRLVSESWRRYLRDHSPFSWLYSLSEGLPPLHPSCRGSPSWNWEMYSSKMLSFVHFECRYGQGVSFVQGDTKDIFQRNLPDKFLQGKVRYALSPFALFSVFSPQAKNNWGGSRSSRPVCQGQSNPGDRSQHWAVGRTEVKCQMSLDVMLTPDEPPAMPLKCSYRRE